jgi:hypothetical protein
VHERDLGREPAEVATAREHLLVRRGEDRPADAVVVARHLEWLDEAIEHRLDSELRVSGSSRAIVATWPSTS